MEKNITKVADLISIVRTAKIGGQYASILGTHETKFNVFPNKEYCTAKGITLASGKGSKALNEPYRFNGMTAISQFKVVFHFGQDYDRTLDKVGATRSANGSVNEIDHFGGIAMGYPSTHNVCLIYMEADRYFLGYYDADGKQITDADTLAYIKGYKSNNKPNAVEYRTLGVRNIKSLTCGGCTYKVDIKDITPKDYDAISTLFKDEYSKVGS